MQRVSLLPSDSSDAVLLDTGADTSVVNYSLVYALRASGGITRRPVIVSNHSWANQYLFVTVWYLTSLSAWVVDDALAGPGLIISWPVMETLGYSLDDIFVRARNRQAEWDLDSPAAVIASVACVPAHPVPPLSAVPLSCASPRPHELTSVDSQPLTQPGTLHWSSLDLSGGYDHVPLAASAPYFTLSDDDIEMDEGEDVNVASPNGLKRPRRC
ncbi:Aste57867_8964 [Aphanomyces stellatus]|uniref:Aste57867_8964 protein n=1 Tax=Aphanomyces stellatus TaxID=120398 RepID=A0A485KLK4_9STRA|nr:hypothetical protein As57867_008929 [Aphanomyces stellatus]VFT85848.1 Aste57867_8964 [Aphanomyces stellatus]